MEQSRIYLERTIRQLEILGQEKRNLLVVSDLHLSEGFDESEGVWSINEDFFFSGQFARFLQFAERQRARHDGAPWRLILNGDIFDFRQVGVPRNEKVKQEIREKRKLEASRSGSEQTELLPSEEIYGPGTTRLMSDWRVDRVSRGHRGFFQALAWFVACGNELVFIKGNHDIELHWLKVQMGIKRQLRRAYDQARASDPYNPNWEGLPDAFGRAELNRIFFLPWNYYESERVYIEHGQQFHGTDSEAYILWPMLPWDENSLELTLGDLFGRYFVNKLEELFPLMDNMKPFSEGVNWILNKGIPSLLSSGSFWSGLKALWAQLKHALKGAASIYKKNRNHRQDYPEFDRERQAELAEYGDRIGLGAACVHDLDALKSPPQLRSQSLAWAWLGIRLLELFGIALLVVALLAALLALALIGAGVTFFGLKKVMLAVSAFSWVASALIRWLKSKQQNPEEHLKDKAGQIHQVLLKHDKYVKYVLLGHDHHAHLQRLDDELADKYGLDVENCFYVNSGTWTAVIVYEAELVQNARQFSFVRMIGDIAHLMRWNDGGGTWEPIVLQY